MDEASRQVLKEAGVGLRQFIPPKIRVKTGKGKDKNWSSGMGSLESKAKEIRELRQQVTV
ncbi:hypothetical protein LTS06_011316 [Exophiala xenobiotica]|nr:hypothetical protein LTS06_011316 [Exophiala xenobiotica]